MVYSDSSTKLGLVEEVDSLCDTDSTSYPTAAKTRRFNAALEKVISWIIGSDATWQFDDSNFTNVPVGTIDLVAGQSQYSFQTAFLEIENVKVKDKGGHWHILSPIDQSQTDIPLEEFLLTNGLPIWYDPSADGLRLYPAPDSSLVTLTAGLKIQFNRTGSLFTASDTTKTPGFATPFHIILAYMTALPYCASYKKDRVAWLEQQIGDTTPLPTGLKRDIINFYSRREKDNRKVIRNRSINPQ